MVENNPIDNGCSNKSIRTSLGLCLWHSLHFFCFHFRWSISCRIYRGEFFFDIDRPTYRQFSLINEVWTGRKVRVKWMLYCEDLGVAVAYTLSLKLSQYYIYSSWRLLPSRVLLSRLPCVHLFTETRVIISVFFESITAIWLADNENETLAKKQQHICAKLSAFVRSSKGIHSLVFDVITQYIYLLYHYISLSVWIRKAANVHAPRSKWTENDDWKAVYLFCYA